MENQNTQPKTPFFTKKKIALGILSLVLTVGLYYLQTGQFFRASILELNRIPPFDGTTFPVKKTLKWTGVTSQQYTDFKSGTLTYDIATNLIDIPSYDANVLCSNDPKNLSWSGNDLNIRNTFLTYVTVYMGKYTGGSAKACEAEGSHPAVDIRGPRLTPIYAIANGMVTKSKMNSGGNGNIVCITHPNVPTLEDPNQKTTYTSCYLHLDSIASSVMEGVVVKKGDEIGKMGMTGLATTYHLHFQLDKENAPYHPFWPFTSAEASASGYDFFTAVNYGLGKDKGLANTVNPMAWVQKYITYNQTATAGTGDTTTSNTNANAPSNTNANVVQQNNNAAGVSNANGNVSVSQNQNQNTSIVTNNNTNIQVNANMNTETNANHSSAATFFSDVGTTNPHYTAIKALKEKGVIGGYSDNTFRPNQTVNRAEATKMLLLAFKWEIDTSFEVGFKDTVKTEWYYPNVATAVKENIVRGYQDDNTFRPQKSIIRAEFFKILLEAARIANTNITFACRDVKGTDWFIPYADYACQKKLLDFSDNMFQPTQNITRAEVAEGIYRMMKEKGEV